jgi:hypothetical protein
MTDEPHGSIKADRCTLNVSGDKGGTLRYRGGSMDYDAVVQQNQFLEIENSGGSVSVRVKFKPKLVKKWMLTETLLEATNIQDKVNAIAKLYECFTEE